MLRLPEEKRHFFKSPFGTLYQDIDEILPLLKDRTVYTVGDVVTQRLLKKNVVPDIAIIDGYSMREPCNRSPAVYPHCIRVKNPAGMITDELLEGLDSAIENTPALLYVDGEEDLAVIPLVVAAREGVIILYGQPGEGVVLKEVTQDAKRKAAEMLALFEKF